MLRLEIVKHREVAIRLQSREKQWTRSFMLAFLIASGLHLAGALIFYIHPFFNQVETHLPPIEVETDIHSFQDENEGSVFALDQETKEALSLLSPIPSEPKIPSLNLPSLSEQLKYSTEMDFWNNPFLEIEEDWAYLTERNKIQETVKPLTILVSGPLAEGKLINSVEHTTIPEFIKTPQQLVYSVQVEGKTGKIFWSVLSSATSVTADVAEFAETILQHIRFAPDEKSGIQNGEIEINFNIG